MYIINYNIYIFEYIFEYIYYEYNNYKNNNIKYKNNVVLLYFTKQIRTI